MEAIVKISVSEREIFSLDAVMWTMRR